MMMMMMARAARLRRRRRRRRLHRSHTSAPRTRKTKNARRRDTHATRTRTRTHTVHARGRMHAFKWFMRLKRRGPPQVSDRPPCPTDHRVRPTDHFHRTRISRISPASPRSRSRVVCAHARPCRDDRSRRSRQPCVCVRTFGRPFARPPPRSTDRDQASRPRRAIEPDEWPRRGDTGRGARGRHTATRTNHAICSRPRHARGDDQRQAHDATTTICRRAREQGT